MPTAQLRRYPGILTSLVSRVVSRSGLTDVTDASRFKRFLAGTARQLDEIYYQIVRVSDVWSLDRATGEDLDRRVADLQPVGLVRLGPRRATGSLVFSRRTVTPDTRVIPIGTIGLTASGIAVRSLREVEITPSSAVQIPGHVVGQDSLPVPGVAIDPGVAGNLIAGSVTRLQGSLVGVDEVTNVTPFSNGRAGESDDELRARAKAYISSLARCGYRAIEFAAIGVSDGTREVVFARAIPNPERRGDVTLFIDDGTGGAETFAAIANELVTEGLLGPPADTAVGGEEYLSLDIAPVRLESGYEVRVNGVPRAVDSEVFLSPTDGVVRFAPALAAADVVHADYTHYTGLIPAVQKVISGVYADPDNFPGWGAAGVQTRVRAPRVVAPSFAGTLYLDEGVDRDTAVAEAESETVRLVNSGSIGEDVVLARIVDVVMEVPGVRDFVLETPSENVTVLDDEISRITSSQVDYD